MGLFDKLESRLEHGVNGAFARAFKSEVQPVELAAGMRRAMDDRASSISKGKRPIVPNLYTFELSPTDYARLAAWGPDLDDELIAAAQEHADEQRYIPGGPFTIVLDEADDLETGVFRLRPTTAKAADARAMAAQYPRHVPEPAATNDTDDEYDDVRHDDSLEAYRHDDHATPHGASRLDDYRREDAYADADRSGEHIAEDYDQNDYADDEYTDGEYAHDGYSQDEYADEYVREDENEYRAYDEHDTHERDAHGSVEAKTAGKTGTASAGGMGARIKNYLFGSYAPEPASEHSGAYEHNTSHDGSYLEHEADERAAADYTAYDEHDEEASYDEVDHTRVHAVAAHDEAHSEYVSADDDFADDPYEYEHTRPAPQKAASRPVRELPKKRQSEQFAPQAAIEDQGVIEDQATSVVDDEDAFTSTSSPRTTSYDDYPAQSVEREQHSGYISYDPDAEYTQRGGYTTYGDSAPEIDVADEEAYDEAPQRPSGLDRDREDRSQNEKRPSKRDQSRSYSHSWDDEDDAYGDATGYEPAPSAPAPPARRVTSPRERPWLKIDGQRYPLMGAITVIGRDDDADIILDDPGVSRRHSEVRITHDGPHLVMSIRDLGSTNGTYINGDRVEAEHLHDGDRLTVGRTSMTIHLGDRP